MPEINGFAVGRSEDGQVILSFFNGCNCVNGVRLQPDNAQDVIEGLQRELATLKEGDD